MAVTECLIGVVASWVIFTILALLMNLFMKEYRHPEFNTRMYLAISADLSQADLLKRVPQLVKLCSATHIETLIRQALPGMPMVHVPSPPGAIPIKLNYQYFALNQNGVAWEAVQRARNIAAYVPADIPNPQLELIILLPQAE